MLKRLFDFVEAGSVTCYYSGIHLSEMSPLDEAFVDAAHRRSTLLSQLCQRNALASTDRLIGAELRSSVDPDVGEVQVYEPEGRWYPNGMVSPIDELDFPGMVEEHLRESGYDRRTRRIVQRKMIRDGRLTAEAAEKIRLDEQLKSLIESYPITPQASKIVWRFAQGRASAAEASAAFATGLLDPAWMMQWFAGHRGHMTPFIEWVRGPALKLQIGITGASQNVAQIRENFGNAAAEQILSQTSELSWRRTTEAALLSAYSKLVDGELDCGRAGPVTLERIRVKCPALWTAFWTLASIARESFLLTPRAPKASDLADAMHAVYAPYVDVFRADAFSAGHIRRHAGPYGVKVVSRLLDLPQVVEDTIAGRG